MNQVQQAAVAAIEKQQEKLQEGSTAWCVGEQLKEICIAEPDSAELIVKDLEIKEMSLAAAESKIKAYADKNHGSARAFGVSPLVAERILREFYGLRKREDSSTPLRSAQDDKAGGLDEIRLEDFV